MIPIRNSSFEARQAPTYSFNLDYHGSPLVRPVIDFHLPGHIKAIIRNKEPTMLEQENGCSNIQTCQNKLRWITRSYNLAADLFFVVHDSNESVQQWRI